MTRVVTSAHRPKRAQRKKVKTAALTGPVVVAAKRSRHPLRAKQAAAEVVSCPDPNVAAQPGPPNKAARCLPGGRVNQKSAIVNSISRKRARQRRAGYTAAEPDEGPADDTLMQAMARMIRPPGAG